MFTSILNNAEGTLSMGEAGICLMTALILGFFIGFTYMSCGTYTKNFVVTLVTLPVLIQIVILMVNGNLGTGVAVMGAFGLIRFRSVPGTSREITNVFFAMAAGLAVGTGYLTFAVLAVVVLCTIQLILYKTPFAHENETERSLKITIPENLDYEGIFDDIFENHTKAARLERVKTTNLGSMFELQYQIRMKKGKGEKKMIDEIRCRNGNLTIVCQRPGIGREGEL